MSTKYRQCQLSRTGEFGTFRQVAYIPSKFAIVDGYVRLKDENGFWQRGWKVDSAGEEVDEANLPDYHEMIKGHRKATGDSMKKEARC